jgi:(p)ppGpp synthase/HD superfamily hydrolase
MLAKAIAFAAAAHEGQTDKLGRPYILHPIAVMDSFEPWRGAGEDIREQLQTVAILHDVVEDTMITVERIAELFGKRIAQAVYAITKRSGETYMQYLERVKADTLALAVKVHDIKHNTSPERLRHLDKSTREYLTAKYKRALDFLYPRFLEIWT